jgi:cysteine synthase A
MEESRLYLKLEGLNIGKSIKLTSALEMVENLKKRGVIDKSTTLIESSSGNLGLALSIICKVKGYSFICVSDPNISPSNAKLIKAYGATLIQISKRDENGGFLGSRIDYIINRVKKDKGLVWVNQYENPDNLMAHYRRTAPEIFNHFPKVDYLIIGSGTTGTLMGCGKYFKEHSPKTKIVAVDPIGSVSFGTPPKPRFVPGLGTSKRPPILDESFVDEVLHIPELDGIKMCHQMLEKDGLLLGGSTGLVLAGVAKMRPTIPPHSLVIAISPDFGEKYLENVYNDEWINNRFS